MAEVAGTHSSRPERSAPAILAVSTYAEPGGGEHLLVDLLGGLAARDFPVQLVMLGDGSVRARAEARGVAVTIAPRVRMTRPHTIVAGASALRRAILRLRPDVVHASNPKAQVVAHLAAAGVPCAHTVQVLDAPPARDPFARVTRHLGGTRFAITAAGAQAWTRAAGGHPVRLIEPGVDDAGLLARAAAGDATGPWARAGLTPGARPRVVMVARLQRYKGVFDFVEVADRARERTDACFLLVGPDEPLEPGTRAALGAEIRTRGLGDRMAVADPLTEADLAAVVADATLAVHAAHRETFGLVVVEALALGTPVVAYAAPGPAHILATGGGVTVPLGDVAGLTAATLALLADPARRAECTTAGRATATRFGLGRMVDEYAAAFESVAAAAGAPAP